MKKAEQTVVLVKEGRICPCGGCTNSILGEDDRVFYLAENHYPEIAIGELVFLKKSGGYFFPMGDENLRTDTWVVIDNE